MLLWAVVVGLGMMGVLVPCTAAAADAVDEDCGMCLHQCTV